MASTKSFFNNAAKIWDRRGRFQNTENISTMLRLSDIRPGAWILDAGCGTGMLEPYLLRYKPEKILAVDFAENMISVAKEKRQDPEVEFLCADVFDISPRKFTCDFCVFYNAFPHFEDHQKLVSHLNRLIRPHGRLTISHTQGRRKMDGEAVSPGLPAQGLIKLLEPYFQLDVLIDNNIFFMVSGISLKKTP